MFMHWILLGCIGFITLIVSMAPPNYKLQREEKQ
jgi:hypothetical protein